MPLDSKHPKASFSPTSTDLLYFQVAYAPKSQDWRFFVDDDNDNDNDTTDYFTPSACARGKKHNILLLDIYFSHKYIS